MLETKWNLSELCPSQYLMETLTIINQVPDCPLFYGRLQILYQ